MCSLQLCSFLSRLIWLFTVLCGSILILEFFHKSTFKPRLLKKTKPNQTCTSYNQSRMFQIIIYFSITYYGSPNMCLYHLHRKLWLPSLALSRSISAVRTTSKCQRATHSPAACWGQQSRILAGSSHSSSGAQSLNTERCCLDSLHLKPWGREFFQSSPCPHHPAPGALVVSGSCPPMFLPRLRSPKACVHPALVFSHPTLEEVLEMPSLVTGINIASALQSHNCAASPIPPPDPICQTVSFEFDLFLDPDSQLDLDWIGYILIESWSCTAGFFTEITNSYV